MGPAVGALIAMGLAAQSSFSKPPFVPDIKCPVCGKDCPQYKKACCDEHWKILNPRPGRILAKKKD